jgi:hypothetical protein
MKKRHGCSYPRWAMVCAISGLKGKSAKRIESPSPWRGRREAME